MVKRKTPGATGPPVADQIPVRPTLKSVRAAADGCRACDLYKRATQTVFGEGPTRPTVMMVGEQPGDAEDVAGHPFVGPAGKLLDRALAEAGIDRARVYLTNVVKHFKWEPRGKRRIHAKPNGAEIAACRPWLETEIALTRPRVIRVPWCDGGAGTAGPRLQGLAATGCVRPLAAGPSSDGHGAPLVDSSRARRRESTDRVAALRG